MNLLLVDDHKLFREGMRYVLEAGLQNEEPLTILEASDCKTALECAADRTELDMVLLDLNLPDCRGLDALQAFVRRFPVLPVVVLSASTQQTDIRQSLELGAMGFIPKDSASSAVINAIRLVMSGNIYVPPALLGAGNLASVNADMVALTDRQREVMQLMAEGKSNKEIAAQLQVAEATVKMHVTHIMRTLNVSNRTQAVVAAEKLGLVSHH